MYVCGQWWPPRFPRWLHLKCNEIKNIQLDKLDIITSSILINRREINTEVLWDGRDRPYYGHGQNGPDEKKDRIQNLVQWYIFKPSPNTRNKIPI